MKVDRVLENPERGVLPSTPQDKEVPVARDSADGDAIVDCSLTSGGSIVQIIIIA